MFEELEKINNRPKPFEFYTASELWTNEHTSKQMLSYHLNEEVDLSSRNTAFIDRSVEWIASHLNVRTGTKIADFGCGPGLYATKLAKMQADVTGIDFSNNSIQYAQEVANREGLSIHYENQNYLEFETDDRFHLIQMIMCDFCALSPSQRKKMLTKFHRFMEPDGFVLLDVYSLNAFEQREETAMYEANLLNGFWSPNKYYGFLNTFKYEKEKVVLDKYTLIEAAARTRIVYNWLQFFSPETLEREFVECGFTIDKFYSDVAGTAFGSQANEFAVVAKKQTMT
jgi:2-polyprenyl-3-methyl-5-hydroxy-6-metoxy-1,4-benzoquinol methylase